MAEPLRQEEAPAPDVHPIAAADLFDALFGPQASVFPLLDASASLDRAVRDLMGLLRAGQGNPLRHTLATAGASLLLGRREAAAELVARAEAIRIRCSAAAVPPPALLALARLHLILCDLDAASAVLRDLAGRASLRDAPEELAAAADLAFAAGDVGVLRELRDRAGLPECDSVPWQYLVMLEAAGLTDHLAAHQSIVAECVRPVQFWQEYFFDSEVQYPPLAGIDHFVDLTTPEKRTLERRITDKLCRFYESRGLPLGPYLGHFTNGLLAYPRRSPAGSAP